jgi:hypothetical protein
MCEYPENDLHLFWPQNAIQNPSEHSNPHKGKDLDHPTVNKESMHVPKRFPSRRPLCYIWKQGEQKI